VSIRSIVALWTLALLAAAGAIAAVLTSDHITGEAPTIALAVPTGLAFIASGIVARTRRPQNGTGVLLILVGFAWYLAALPTSDQPHLFTVGALLNGLFIGFLAHLLLAFPSGRLTTRLERFVAAAMYVVVAILPLFVLLFDEGEVSSSFCERGTCPDNLLATVPQQTVANVLAFVYGSAAGLLSITVAVLLIRRWRRASPALRSALNPIVLAAGVLIATFAVQIVASGFSDRAARAVNWVLLTAMLALPLAFLYGLLRPRLTASSRRLAAELAEQRRPEEIQDVLRRALRDPTLELGYLTTTKHGYVDVDGETLRLPGPDSGRAVTDIGQEIIVHDSALADQPELDEVVDAARLALERGLSLRSLEATERRESALLDAIPDNVYRTSADGVLLEAHVKDDGAEGKFAQGVVGRRIGDVLPAELSDLVMDGVRRALETGEAVTIEYSVESPDGVQHLEERIVRSGNDEAVGIVRDVTERKRQERELQALVDEQAALSRVAVAVATERRPEAVFNVVTEEVARLFEAPWAATVRYEEAAEEVTVVGEWHGGDDFELELGSRFPLGGGAITKVKETGRPARLAYTLADDDYRPPGVDRRREMVAAPILVTGRIWGAATMSMPAPGSFPADAEVRLGKFTSLVALAIGNAEAREQLAGLADEQAAITRVAVAVATERDPQRVFDVVTEEAARVLGAEGSNLIRYEPEGLHGLVVGEWRAPGAGAQSELVGKLLLFDGPTAVARVRETGKPARLDPASEFEGEAGERLRALGVKSAVAAPIYGVGHLWGSVVVASSDPEAFGADAEERLGKFANLVAVAIANAEAHEQLTASRARIVRAGDEERSRLERNLHDGAQQRLVALSLALRLVQSRLDDDPAGARELLDAAAEELTLALEELRELARGIHPAILTNRGLPAALEALATRAPVPVELHRVCQDRLPPSVEAAAYYVVAESLTNIAKYAQASAAQVSVTRRDGLAIVEVEDDGVGGADAAQGSGLRGLADRVESLEGRLDIESAPGRGTRVRAEIPIGSG
jgi:signal transduction histidine kinase/PAS domain-containing protein